MPISRYMITALVIVIDAAVAIVSTLFLATVVQDPIMQIIVGLLVFVTVGISSFKIMFAMAQEEIDDIFVQSELVKLGFDGRAWNKPESQSLKDLLRTIADYWSRRDKLPSYLSNLLDNSLENIQKALDKLSYGKVHFVWQDIRAFASRALGEAKNGDEIFTTSYVSTCQWWLGRSGKEYLITKRDAADKGVEIVQIFISPDKDSLRKDENIIRELAKPTKGKPIKIYAISEGALPHDERRDALLLKREHHSFGFELDLKGRTWVEGFYVYTHEKTKTLEDFFDKILVRSGLAEFDAKKHQNFEDFVDEVFA